MIAPTLVLYMMVIAVPIGLFLGIKVHRSLATDARRPAAILTVFAGTALTVATVGLMALATTQIYGAIAFPKYTATIIEIASKTGMYEDDDGDLESRTYYRSTYEFTGPDGQKITRRSDQSGTLSARKGDKIQIAYKDGTMLELNGLGYVFLGVFVLVALISFWLWHIMMSRLWR